LSHKVQKALFESLGSPSEKRDEFCSLCCALSLFETSQQKPK